MRKRKHTGMQVRWLFVLCMLFLLFGGNAAASQPDRKMTVMVYMCGSNLESENGAATADITEMLKSRFDSSQVSVLVMAGGSTRWWGGFSPDETSVWEISGNRPKQVWSEGLKNMGDAETLAGFLRYGREQYPAEAYSLVLWDHGGGPMNGVCWDSLADSDHLDMNELQTALESGGCGEMPLEWIGFDACLMSSVETAYVVSPYARYMIASQETEPGTGWNYAFLKEIAADADGGKTGGRIVDTYFEGAIQTGADLTLSCIDLSKMEDVETAMDSFFSELTVDLNEESFAVLSNLRQGTKGFGRADNESSDYDLVDLIDLTNHYAGQAPEEAGLLLEALEEAVVCSRSNVENSNGISVYHPYYNKDMYQAMWQEEYAGLFFSPGYTEYIREFADIWLGDAMGDWSKLMPVEEEPEAEDADSLFSVQLSREQEEQFASAQLLVLEKDTGWADQETDWYRHVYVTDEVLQEGDGWLSAEYRGRTLYALDENGNPLTEELSYRMQEGKYVISANFIKNQPHKVTHTVYYCRGTADGGLEILSHYIYDEESGQFTNRLTVDPADYDSIYFPITFYEPVYEGDTLLAFEDWEQAEGLYAATELENPLQNWSFGFLEESVRSRELYAAFQIRDVQANTYSSELLEVKNRNLTEVSITPSETEIKDCRIRTSAVVDTARAGAGLKLKLEVTNLSQEELTVSSAGHQWRINGTRSGPSSEAFFLELKPGETKSDQLVFDALFLSSIDEVSALDGVLTVSGGEDRETELHYELSADVSTLGDDRTAGTALAEAEAEGVFFELLDMRQDESGSGAFTVLLHCTNESETLKELSLEGIAVNGYLLKDLMTSGITLQPGSDTYKEIEVYNEYEVYGTFEELQGTGYPAGHDLLGRWGVEEIREISLVGKDFRADFVLEETLPYEKNAPDLLEEGKILFEALGTTVSVESVWAGGGVAALNLTVENPTSEHWEFTLLQPEINGAQAEFNWIYQNSFTAYAKTVSRESLELKMAEEGEETLRELSMLVRCVDGDQKVHLKKVSIRLDEPAAWQTEEGTAIPAEGLEIKAEEGQEVFGGEDAPVFEPRGSWPDDAGSFRKTISISLASEKAENLESASAVIAMDVSSKLTDVELDTEEKEIRLLWPAARADLEYDGTNSLIGRFSGLIPMVYWSDGEATLLKLWETWTDEETMEASLWIFGTIYSREEMSEYLIEEWHTFDFDVNADYEKGDVRIENLRIDTGSEDRSDWPASCFASINAESYFYEVEAKEDETAEFGENTWLADDGELVLTIDGSPVAVTMNQELTGDSMEVSFVPLESMDCEAYVLCYLNYRDGSGEILGPWPYDKPGDSRVIE